jgi:nicotinate phosphoribosyltransferase
MEDETMRLPKKHEPYTDVYFLRAQEVLKKEGINPVVRAQIFIRKGQGNVYGINEALAIIDKYSDLKRHGGRVHALPEGSTYSSCETLMTIEGPVQDIITLETMILGAITEKTSLGNGDPDIDLEKARENMEAVVKAAKGRPVSYFGARHWHFSRDREIAYAAFLGGATSCSTDIGASKVRRKGMGTIPHALENIMAWIHGYDNAVVESTEVFDRTIDPEVPRIALIDYANREVKDSLAVAQALGEKLYGVRVDTCGENVAEGGLEHPSDDDITKHFGMMPSIQEEDRKYWFGRGVTVAGVYTLRTALDKAGFDDVKIILSSGFGDAKKVSAFVRAEEELGLRLFDGLGVGGIYESRISTWDIVGVGETMDTIKPLSKKGRPYRPNQRLQLVYGGA